MNNKIDRIFILIMPILVCIIICLFGAIYLNINLIPEVLIIILLAMITVPVFEKNEYLIFVTLMSSILYIPLRAVFKAEMLIYALDYFLIISYFKLLLQYLSFNKKFIMGYILIITFIVIILIGTLGNNPSFYESLNGYWNYLRFMGVFLLILSSKLSDNFIIKINYFIIFLNFIQLPITIFQYLIGLDRDFIGGFFRAGGTGILMVFNFWGICFFTAKYKYKQITISKYLFYMAVLLIPSILGEIKATFLILPIVFIFIFSELKFSLRNIFLIAIGIIGSILLMKLLIIFYPDFATLFTDRDYFLEYTFMGKYGDYGLNRFSSIVYIWNNALTTTFTKLFGLGVGVGTPSSSIIFNGSFYQMNNLLRYEWFQAPYMLVESGGLGLLSYIGIILYSGFLLKSKNINNLDCKPIILGGGAFLIVHIINIFYNQVMFEYYGAFFWIMMALSLKTYLNNSFNS